MSGECYPIRHSQMDAEISKEVKTRNKNEFKSTSNKKENFGEFSEYEALVSSAESKCTQLKGQIERMKQFYNSQHETTRTSYNETADLKCLTGKIRSYTETINNRSNSSGKVVPKFRQNSRAIATDTSGAALGTINNILAGITKPIHKPDFYCGINNNSNKVESFCVENGQESMHGVEEVKINTKSKQSLAAKSQSKACIKKSKSKTATIASATNFKKLKKTTIKMLTDKRHILKPSIHHMKKSEGAITKQRSIKKVVKLPTNRSDLAKIIDTSKNVNEKSSDLVEIYHNNAIKETKSSESEITKKKTGIEKPKTNLEIVPPLSIHETENQENQCNQIVSLYRNYTMPTISSRMKQVAKCYMNSYKSRCIPFCLSTSTSPSHNIGINIQQVMSMIKSKQPFGKLSPTLAYNIGLATNKDETGLPLLLSSVPSKNFSSQCPLIKSAINYQHLQEVAKTIPQETIQEIDENDEISSPETQSIIITGPSGDVKVKNRKQIVWAASSDDQKCTCVQPKGVAFQQIVNKFNNNTFKSRPDSNYISKMNIRSNDKRFIRMDNGTTNCVQNKEKKLKEVLGKLHDEFEKMTKTYDELVKKNEENKSDPNILKELEKLDKELNSKEEEIVMVMSLYKEVLALKQQVKTLKSRASRENLSIKTDVSKFANINNAATAGLLNQLLQRVQHFQTHYKK